MMASAQAADIRGLLITREQQQQRQKMKTPANTKLYYKIGHIAEEGRVVVLQIASGSAATEVAESAQVEEAIYSDGAPFSLRESCEVCKAHKIYKILIRNGLLL